MILCIGDVHFPYVNNKKLNEVLKFIKEHKPTHVIQLGDLFDMFAFSKYPRKYGYNPIPASEEISWGYDCAKEMWATIKKYSPNSICYQLKGNHDTRLEKRIMEKLPELSGLWNFDHLWKFDKVHTIQDAREELILKGIIFMHGFKKFGDHVKYNLQSTVRCHDHKGGVLWVPHKEEILYELDCGALVDHKADVFKYSPQKISKCVDGFGVIDKYGPRFITL